MGAEQLKDQNSELEIYLKIFEHSKDSIFLVDSESFEIMFNNPKSVEDTTYEDNELIGMKFEDLFLEEEKPAIKTMLETTLQWNTGTDPYRILKRKTGRKLYVEIATSVVELGGKKTLFCNVRDISARVKDEKKIKKYSEELQQINAELEQRVEDRTKEIVAQKKEIEDVMSNIQQAIFTVNRECKVNAQHSKYVENVFGIESAAGLDIAEFIYQGDQLEKSGDNLRGSLELCYMQPDKWSLIAGIMPSELQYEKAVDGEMEMRDLKFEWFPIYNGEDIEKVMVIALDITDAKRLQEKIAKAEKEHNDQLNLISQLIQTPKEVVDQFVYDSRRQMELIAKCMHHGAEGIDADLLKELMRAVHTLKGGAGQFDLKSVQKSSHELETYVTEYLDQPEDQQDKTQFFDNLCQRFDVIGGGLQTVFEFYDKVMGEQSQDDGVEKLSIPVARIQHVADMFSDGQQLVPHDSVAKAVRWLVASPVSNLFSRLEKVAEKASQELEKPIRMTQQGGHIEIDQRLMGPLYDAFLHVVRNGLSHGAEDPELREELGKDPNFNMQMSAELDNEMVKFTFIDDGQGVDTEKVKNKALEKGLIDVKKAEKMSEEEIIQTIFMAGFSTQDKVTQLAGRGVGLDMVKEVVERQMAGEIRMYSTPGKGAKLIATIPQNALDVSSHTHYCLFSDESDLSPARLATSLNYEFSEYQDDPAMDEQSTILVDSKMTAKVEVSDQVICVDQMEPAQMINDIYHGQDYRHYVDSANPAFSHYLRATIGKLSGHSIWGIENYLWPGTPVTEVTLKEYGKKNAVIEQMIHAVDSSSLRVFTGLSEILGLVADEMIMNAMFDAPRDENGKEKYNHLSRKENLVLEDHEVVKFRYGMDSGFIAISIEDPNGALDYETLANYMKKCYAKQANQIDQKEGGAGLGLYTIIDNAHCMVVNVDPGERTEVIALFVPTKSFGRYQKIGKSLSYFKA